MSDERVLEAYERLKQLKLLNLLNLLLNWNHKYEKEIKTEEIQL
jgi:hypothetical protein